MEEPALKLKDISITSDSQEQEKELDNLKEDDDAQTPDETLMVVPGRVTECTPLQSMAINKVKLERKGIKDSIEAFALLQSMRVRGKQMDSAVDRIDKRTVEIVFLIRTLNNITLESGTQIGLF